MTPEPNQNCETPYIPVLEKMDDFFAARLEGYDEHMRANIEGASAFYAYTASLLPQAPGARVLDLGPALSPSSQTPGTRESGWWGEEAGHAGHAV